MLKLDNITLIALGSTSVDGMANALDYSSQYIDFGSVKLVSHYCPRLHNKTKIEFEYINKIKSIDEWNKAIIFELWRYVKTDFAILIHPDGYIVHPNSWRNEFLEYDYIGAPWPLPTDDYSYRTPDGEIIRVGNSVSLRSRKILELPKKLNLEWKEYFGNTNEDGFLCCHNRRVLQANGCKFADIDVAKYFSHETMLPETEGIVPFAFHKFSGTNRFYTNFE